MHSRFCNYNARIVISHVADSTHKCNGWVESVEFNHPFYKALWYYYEMEARADYWCKKASVTAFIDIDVSDFKDVEKMVRLMNSLGVKFSEKQLAEYVGSHINKKIAVKQQEKLAAVSPKKMHKKFQKFLVVEGVHLPSSIAYVG